jgi:hypothetical protein
MGMSNAIAFFFFLVLGIGTAKLAQWENDRERMELVTRTGGEGSPWLASSPMTTARVKVEAPVVRATATRQFWNELDHKYSKEQIEAIERDPWIGVDLPATAPEPAPLHTPETLVQPALQPVVTTGCTTGGATGCGEPEILSSTDWLEQNKCFFPVLLPPAQVTNYRDRKALVNASVWVERAITAGVSQNKIVTVVFGQSKGTEKYNRIVSLIKDVKS